eukprot:412358_1
MVNHFSILVLVTIIHNTMGGWFNIAKADRAMEDDYGGNKEDNYVHIDLISFVAGIIFCIVIVLSISSCLRCCKNNKKKNDYFTVESIENGIDSEYDKSDAELLNAN